MIRTDWTSKEVVFCDFETQSLEDLKKVGGRKYACSPYTRAAMCAFSGAGRRSVWVSSAACPYELPVMVDGFEVCRGQLPPAWVLEAIACGVPLCAHNALEFDAHVWNATGWPDAIWRDTIPLCRSCALPGALDAACELLFGTGKEQGGHRVWMAMCRSKVVGGEVCHPVGTPEAWVASAMYCCQDIALLERLHAEVVGAARPADLSVHQVINDRGIPIDVAFAARLALLQDELAVRSGRAIHEITEEDLEVADARSAAKVKRWFVSRGVRLPLRDGRASLDRRDLQKFLQDPEEFGGDETAAAVAKLRMEATRSTGGKAMRMVSAALETGRAYGQYVYHGAHTGRFSAREVQPHNFPRGVEGVDSSLARDDLSLGEVDSEAARLGCTAGDIISALLRPCVAPIASVADYGAVEARGVCWAAGEDEKLKAFADPRADVYVDLAKVVYGVETVTKGQRWNAKQAELGCGYGMGHAKFSAMLEQWGISSEGVTARHLVDAYRRTHPAVVRGWKQLDRAFLAAAEGGEAQVCRAKLYRLGSCVCMELPSGRRVLYRDARVEMSVPWWGGEPLPTVTYRHPRGWRGTLYGGREMENLVQGLCADLLLDAAARAEAAGLEPCMHTHDELAAERGTAADLAELMSKPPGWAHGFPVLVEAFSTGRYFKKPPDGKYVVGLNGKIVQTGKN